jgi:carboxypeptidase T
MMSQQRITVFGKDFNAMADLVRKYRISLASHDAKSVPTGGYRVDVFADEGEIAKLAAAGYQVMRHGDTRQASHDRQAELRKAVAKTGPAHAGNLATLDRYLLVEEVESALGQVIATNRSFTELITLPHKTWEGRTCTAIRIGTPTSNSNPRLGIYFLGGVHAREWGSPDILINFIIRLTDAYNNKTGITLGQKQFSFSDVQAIIETKTLYIFPQANPDGRAFSMNHHPDWRKNRRPAPSGSSRPECVGVDINRNYDFLWDFTKYFDPNAPVQNSTDPCDAQVYIGPAPTSEPETRNAVWILDQHPDIRYFIDLHSYSEDILYSWGDADDQTTNPQMNFQNPAFNGKRGIPKDAAYGEYLASDDKAFVVTLAEQMQAAIEAVRNRQYSVIQSLNLYPTAGTSDDYAFSRHFADTGRTKVYAYTIEWGSEKNPTPFHPPYAEMSQIIAEVTSGLFEFCLRTT